MRQNSNTLCALFGNFGGPWESSRTRGDWRGLERSRPCCGDNFDYTGSEQSLRRCRFDSLTSAELLPCR